MTVPNWKIERYLLGELPEGEMNALKNLENEELRLQIEQLKNSNAELLAKHPYKRKFTVLSNVPIVPLRLAAIFLLCASVLLAMLSNEDIYEDGTRVKGLKTSLEIWRKTPEQTEQLTDNSEAKAGDLLQIRYSALEPYGTLLSLDGNGVLTIHLSGKNGKAAHLEAGKIISLKNAYELDNAPKFETFYLITANKEFELAPVVEKLLQGKTPSDLRVEQIKLRKR
ncbi:hypothetical protein R83H12_00973 [Fibrobacteria bacterium R8-3-H12]